MPKAASARSHPDPLTVAGTLRRARDLWPDRKALVINDRAASYAALWDEVAQCARGLMAQEIAPGSRIGIYLANSWEYVVLFYAAAAIGATTVAINARFRNHELAYAIEKARLTALVSTRTGRHFDGCAIADMAGVAGDEEFRLRIDLASVPRAGWTSWAAMIASGEASSESDLERRIESVDAASDCLIMFSSGTTANPKACRLSHKGSVPAEGGMTP